MKTPSDHWRDLAEADAVENELMPDEQAFLAEYAGDDEIDDERALFAGIALLGEPAAMRADDRERAEATLGEFKAHDRGVSRVAVGGIVAVLAMAAAVTLWVFARPAELAPATVAEVRVSEGTFMLAESRIESGDAVPGGEWVRTTTRACVDIESSRACFDPGSELRILEGVVELRKGLMRVDEGAVSLMEDEGVRELAAGDVLARTPVRTAANEPVPVPVPEAAPEEEQTLEADTDEPRRSKPRTNKTAGEMLSEARQLANKGQLGPAVNAYGALRRSYPGSAEAHAANVSMGQLQLRRGKASAALSAFDRYLQRGGGLAEEARWGRVEALHRMGKKAARDKAIDRLLAAHPNTVYATKARALRAR